MISTESFSPDWINRVCEETSYNDKALLEKAIHALALLEVLVSAGCPLIFKGGSSLLLILNDSLHRLSIDIDVVCPPGTDIEYYLAKAGELGFTHIAPVGTEHPGNNVPVSHSKAFYELAFNAQENGDEGFIRLDVLFEDNHYSKTTQISLEHKILKTEGSPSIVTVPTIADILGDKLTAFGPNTIGIPYYKKSRSCSLEIIKQVFDIGRLFERVTDFNNTFQTFKKISAVELSYRGLEGQIAKYYEDVRQTAICIARRGTIGIGNFREINNGLKRIKSYMYQSNYYIESAIIDSSRAAYLASCFEKGITSIDKYEKTTLIKDLTINDCLPIQLFKLRASSPESYYYWAKTGEILSGQ